MRKIQIKDELENSLEITKDNYGNIVKCLNALGEINNKEYGDKLELVKQYLSDEDTPSIQEVNYQYYEENKLMKKVTLKNGTYYDYYYETQLYWLSLRYYSPELCRLISSDSIEYLDHQSINGIKLYCYCMNNSIFYFDQSVNVAKLIWYFNEHSIWICIIVERSALYSI